MRNLSGKEISLIQALLSKHNITPDILGNLETLIIEEMNDGGMGSLRVIPISNSNQHFGKQLAEGTLLDKDNVPVSYAVNIDTHGNFYELDVFKADSNALVAFPDPPYNFL